MRIPPELFVLIAEDLLQLRAVASLARLSRVSSQVHALVTPVLYHSISLHTVAASHVVYHTLKSKAHLAAHVRRLFLASAAVAFEGPITSTNQPNIFVVCAHIDAVEIRPGYLMTGAGLFTALDAAAALRRLVISYVAHRPLRMLSALARHQFARHLEDLHMSNMETTTPLLRAATHAYSPFVRLRMFSCTYAVDIVSPSVVINRKLEDELLPACTAFAALPALQRLCIFLHPTEAAGLVRNGRFCDRLRSQSRPGLRIALAIVELSDERAIVEREAGWYETGLQLLEDQ